MGLPDGLIPADEQRHGIHAVDPLLAFTARSKGEVLFRSDTAEDLKGLPPAYELSWNHTTLRGLRIDPDITYLQVLYPYPHQLDLVDKVHARFGDEVKAHLEFVRFDGNVTCFGLPIVRFTTEERLEEIMASLPDPVSNDPIRSRRR